jgi:hypothetical protein
MIKIRNVCKITVVLCSLLCGFATAERGGQLEQWQQLSFSSRASLNLHHFLYELARDQEQLEWALANKALRQSEKETLDLAVAEYKKFQQVRGTHILFSDSTMSELTSILMMADQQEVEKQNNSLFQAYKGFLPIYQRVFWPVHLTENKIWLNTLLKKLTRYGEPIQVRLSQVFQSKLVLKPVHKVDIVYKPGIRQGAYTSRNAHSIINSSYADYQDWQAMEIVFHELCHTIAVNRSSKLRQLIKTEFERAGMSQHMDIWHPILFYSVGQIVKQNISSEQAGYQSYATKNNLYQTGWQYPEAIFIECWQPYLDGLISMQQAIQNLAEKLKETAS